VSVFGSMGVPGVCRLVLSQRGAGLFQVSAGGARRVGGFFGWAGAMGLSRLFGARASFAKHQLAGMPSGTDGHDSAGVVGCAGIVPRHATRWLATLPRPTRQLGPAVPRETPRVAAPLRSALCSATPCGRMRDAAPRPSTRGSRSCQYAADSPMDIASLQFTSARHPQLGPPAKFVHSSAKG